jgi:hypothetical protein
LRHSAWPKSVGMDLFTRIIQRLRPPAAEPSGGAIPPAPPTLAELHEMFDSIVIDRAEAEAVILHAPARRDALLDQPGTDKAIRKLDSEVDAAHLLLERLERVRPELQQRIAAATLTTRGDAWAVARSQLVEKATHCVALMSLAEMAFNQFCNLRIEIARAGFVEETRSLPYHADQWRIRSNTMQMARAGIARQPMMVRVEPDLWTVRFLQWTMVGAPPFTTAYQTMQQAGFLADEAWRLVNSGKAEWADPKRIPPKPRKRRKGEIPAPVSPEAAASFGSGPVDPAEEVQNAGRRDRQPVQLGYPGSSAAE